MRQMVWAAIAAVFLAASPVVAADMNSVSYDPTLEPSDWTGFYAGAWVGGRVGTVTPVARLA